MRFWRRSTAWRPEPEASAMLAVLLQAAAFLPAQAGSEDPMDRARGWVAKRDLSEAEAVIRAAGGDARLLSELPVLTQLPKERREKLWADLAELLGPRKDDRRESPRLRPRRPLEQGALVAAEDEGVRAFYVTPEGEVLADQLLRVAFPSRSGWLRGELRVVAAVGLPLEDVIKKGVRMCWRGPGADRLVDDQVVDRTLLKHGVCRLDLDIPVLKPGRHTASLVGRSREICAVVFDVRLGSKTPSWRSP